MASKTDKLFKGMSTKKIANVASMGGEVLDLPNYSGDHSAGTTETPTADYHLTNKKYVDDNIGDVPFGQTAIMGHNRGLSIGVASETFPNIADMVKMTDTKGITMISDGGITGISINYNLGFPSGLFSGINMKVKINGSVVWTNPINSTNGADKEEHFSQSIGAVGSTFSAGDTVSVCFQGVGSGSISMSKAIICLQYYYG